MREIRIKNLKVETLIHIVIAFKAHNIFLLKEKVYNWLKSEALVENKTKMSFLTEHEGLSIKTVIEFSIYDNQFYKIDTVIVNNDTIYGHSPWRDSISEIVINAE